MAQTFAMRAVLFVNVYWVVHASLPSWPPNGSQQGYFRGTPAIQALHRALAQNPADNLDSSLKEGAMGSTKRACYAGSDTWSSAVACHASALGTIESNVAELAKALRAPAYKQSLDEAKTGVQPCALKQEAIQRDSAANLPKVDMVRLLDDTKKQDIGHSCCNRKIKDDMEHWKDAEIGEIVTDGAYGQGGPSVRHKYYLLWPHVKHQCSAASPCRMTVTIIAGIFHDVTALRHDYPESDPEGFPDWFNAPPLSDCPRCYEELRVVQLIPMFNREALMEVDRTFHNSGRSEILEGIMLPMVESALGRRPGHVDPAEIDLYGWSGAANGVLRIAFLFPTMFSNIYALDPCVNLPEFTENASLTSRSTASWTSANSFSKKTNPSRVHIYQGYVDWISCDPNMTAFQKLNQVRPQGQPLEIHLLKKSAHLSWCKSYTVLLPQVWSQRQCANSDGSFSLCFGLESTTVLWVWLAIAVLLLVFEVARLAVHRWEVDDLAAGLLQSQPSPDTMSVVEPIDEVILDANLWRGEKWAIAQLGLVLARQRRSESCVAAVWQNDVKQWHILDFAIAGNSIQQIEGMVERGLRTVTPASQDHEVDFLWSAGQNLESPTKTNSPRARIHAILTSTLVPGVHAGSQAKTSGTFTLQLHGTDSHLIADALRHAACNFSSNALADDVQLYSEVNLQNLLTVGRAPRQDENVYSDVAKATSLSASFLLDPSSVQPIHGVVAEVARSRGSSLAILGTENITYDELLGWAAQVSDQIAQHVAHCKLACLEGKSEEGSETSDNSTMAGNSGSDSNSSCEAPALHECVALLLPRGAALVAAMLGVLKSGRTYVPLDVYAPEERWNTIIADCEAKLVIASPESRQGRILSVEILNISKPSSIANGYAAWTNAQAAARAWYPDDVAAVYYTSGSSGKPKGVQVSHRYITFLSSSIIGSRKNHSKTVTAMYHSPTWMTCLDNVFSSLLVGGAVAMFPPSDSHKLDLQAMHKFLKNTGATRISAVPVVADTILSSFDDLPSLECMGVGGAAFPQATAKRLMQNAGGKCMIATAYGGTEYGDATFLSLTQDTVLQGWTSGLVPGGSPHGWQHVFVVEAPVDDVGNSATRKLNLCREGFVGEIAIAGPGLASGYLNKPELSNRSFIPNPFKPEEAGDKLYLSGDLGVWEKGSLRIMGRVDNQVKVNGLRIELGEIETVLSEVPGVRSSAVVVLNNLLVAYAEPATLVTEQLRAHCEKLLPPYMVPKTFVCLDALPTLPNGKINRKELPAPETKGDVVTELDSLGMMRRFRVRTLVEDRILDNIRAFLLCMVVVSHSAGGATAASWDVIESWAAPWQQGVIIASAGGGWMALSFASGFDDARSLEPYAFQVRELLFIVLWFVGQRHWTFWFFPAFVMVRGFTILAHRLKHEKAMLCLWAFTWLLLPQVFQMQPVPLPSATNPVEAHGPCLALYDLPWFKTLMEWSLGDTVIRQGITRTFIFAPCYWLGFYGGRNAMQKICKAMSLSRQKRIALLLLLLSVYLGLGFGYGFGLELLESRYVLVPWVRKSVAFAAYDDLCSSFYAKGLWWLPLRMLLNWLHMALTVFLSCLYVVIVALAPIMHLKTMAKTSFPALIVHGFVPCLLNIQGWCVEILAKLGAGFHTEMLQLLVWFGVPILFVWIAGQLLFHLMRTTFLKLRQLITQSPCLSTCGRKMLHGYFEIRSASAKAWKNIIP